jgi:hypothetical protein
MPSMSSYLFENFVLNFCESKEILSDYIDINIVNFWNYLKSQIYNEVKDPKGIEHNLNQLSNDEKSKIAEKANDAYLKGYEAYRLETKEKDQKSAINKWGEIFGDDFPKYE